MRQNKNARRLTRRFFIKQGINAFAVFKRSFAFLLGKAVPKPFKNRAARKGKGIAGVFIISIINNMLNLFGVSSFYQFVCQGLILILALSLSAMHKKH